MWDSMKKWAVSRLANGIYLPVMKDQATNTASITLTFAYITFWTSIISVGFLHYHPSFLVATCTAIGFWFLATVLYIIRKINKASFDFTHKELSLENTEDSTS
jgi:hypothetical protein